MALAYALLYLPSFNSVLCPCPPWCPLYLHLCSASQGFCSHFLPCCWQLSRLSVLPPLANVLPKFIACALQQSVDCMLAFLHCILHCMFHQNSGCCCLSNSWLLPCSSVDCMQAFLHCILHCMSHQHPGCCCLSNSWLLPCSSVDCMLAFLHCILHCMPHHCLQHPVVLLPFSPCWTCCRAKLQILLWATTGESTLQFPCSCSPRCKFCCGQLQENPPCISYCTFLGL